MTRAASMLVACVLLGGCSLVASLDDYEFGDDLDAGPGMDGGDAGGGGTDAGDIDAEGFDAGFDAGEDNCGGCSDPLPVCNPDTSMCVECVVSSDCDSGVCDGNECQEVIDFAAGGFHTCAVLEDGSVWCWGLNDQGQVGDGTMATPRASPRRVTVPPSSAVIAGFAYSCAVTVGGEVRCWGSNRLGETTDATFILGEATPELSSSPVATLDMVDGAGFESGNDHACFLTSLANEVRCWGTNWAGQLGDGSFDSSGDPVGAQPMAGMSLVADEVSAGGGHSCARRGSDVFCWGDNAFGQLGVSDVDPRSRPTLVSGVNNPRALSAYGTHTCAVGSDGVYCWGDNPDNRLGDGSTNPALTPRLGVAGSNFQGVVGGAQFSCAWTDTGEARCWGDGGAGQYGDGTVGADLSSHLVSLANIQRVVAGEAHACAMADGSLHCWGLNDHGALGDGTTTLQSSPVRVVWP